MPTVDFAKSEAIQPPRYNQLKALWRCHNETQVGFSITVFVQGLTNPPPLGETVALLSRTN